MAQQKRSNNNIRKRVAASSIIFLSFIVALEIFIMISPFAFFFYAAFNPFLLALNQSSMTRWLTAFFLPHIVVPPNEALKIIRVLGSVFSVGGVLVFLICAVQVYMGKLLKKGVATKGFYAIIRHPQYLGLGFTALGLAIMWPRFLILTLFAIMLFLYYLLARDEERRMISCFGESYIAYMNRTGMFLPRFIKKALIRRANSSQTLRIGKAVAILLVLIIVIVGSGFILRVYTVHHLLLEQINGVDVITIVKEDLITAKQVLPSVLQNSVIASKLQPIENRKGHRLLAYFIPIDYEMQGMIANTGWEWKKYEQHKTIAMIIDYIFHPFTHLTRGSAMETRHSSMNNNQAMKRRIIFIEVCKDNRQLTSSFDDFDINARRTPLFFVDVQIHSGEIFQVQNTPV
jgi:protein-S-isoprenylcysteine O-methyltransferase Ste14